MEQIKEDVLLDGDAVQVSFAVGTKVEEKVETAQIGEEGESVGEYLVVWRYCNRARLFGCNSVSVVITVYLLWRYEICCILHLCLDFHLVE